MGRVEMGCERTGKEKREVKKTEGWDERGRKGIFRSLKF